MRQKYNIEMGIPQGVNCEYSDRRLICRKGDAELSREMILPKTDISIKEGKIIFSCPKANKKNVALIKTNLAHIKNMFNGLEEEFMYELEICYVHFPITVKLDKNIFTITNFLGEKVNRSAEILDGVKVEIKGQNITVTSRNLEKAGQTAANIEKASKVGRRDRRVFQDGIFMTSKPKGAI